MTLRSLQRDLDYAIATAYSWTNFDLGHGFHETKRGLRYTIYEEARRTVLDSLLALNHQRHAEEEAEATALAAQGKATTKRSRKRDSDDSSIVNGLFDQGEANYEG